jgi:hypothetical protein
MTDNYNLIPNNHGITSDALYNMKASAVRSRSYRASILPSNKQVFVPGDVIVLALPCGRRNTFLDPTQTYLRFTVRNYDQSNSLTLDGSAACFINRCDIFHSSNLLESIQTYNILFQYLIDFSTEQSFKLGIASAWGCTADRSGYQLAAPAASVTTQATFCIPIVSGVIGTLAEKFLPIGMMGDDLRIELSLEGVTQSVAYGTTTVPGTLTTGSNGYSWNIINVELECCIVELSDEGMTMVNNVTPFSEPVYLHSSTYRHFVSTLPSGSSGMFSTLVPARFSSLKSLALCPRRADEITGLSSFSLGSRCNFQCASAWYRIGSFLVPQKPITLVNSSSTGSFAEAFMETLRSFHALNNYLVSTSIPIAYYNVNDAALSDGSIVTAVSTTTNSYKNAFALGLELESFALRNDVLLSGMNTLSTNVFFECNLNSTAPAKTYTLDFYAFLDMIVVLQDGILSVKF